MNFFFVGKIGSTMYIHALDVMETFLRNFRLTILRLRKNPIFRQLLSVSFFIGNHELIGLTVNDVTLAATLQVVLAFFVGAKFLLQKSLFALAFKLSVLVSTSFRKAAEECVEVLAVMFVANIQLSLVMIKFSFSTMCTHQFDETFTLVLMEELACHVPVPVTLFLYEFTKETLGSMCMVTAAAPVLFLGHRRYKSFCLVKGFLDCGLANQALQKFLVKFERA